MLYAWFHYSLDGITVATLGIQFYLLWLILFKTPKRMASFRYSLFMLMQNEIFLAFTIGFGIDPDLLLESGYRGAIFNGISHLIGSKNGARIMFAMGLYFGAGIFSNQIYCLIFRYTAIQQNYPNLHEIFNTWMVRFYFGILQYSLTISCGILAFHCLADPEETKQLLQHPYFANPNPESAALLAKNDTAIAMLSTGNGVIYFVVFMFGGYSLITAVSIFFSVLIYGTINRNANDFGARTYKLHLQLTALLIVQFCLPIIFLMLPISFAVYSLIFGLTLINTIGQPLLLLFVLYLMANSLCTLFFIVPYREFTLQWLRLKKQPEKEKRQAQGLKLIFTQQQSQFNKIAPPIGPAALPIQKERNTLT